MAEATEKGGNGMSNVANVTHADPPSSKGGRKKVRKELPREIYLHNHELMRQVDIESVRVLSGKETRELRGPYIKILDTLTENGQRIDEVIFDQDKLDNHFSSDAKVKSTFLLITCVWLGSRLDKPEVKDHPEVQNEIISRLVATIDKLTFHFPSHINLGKLIEFRGMLSL